MFDWNGAAVSMLTASLKGVWEFSIVTFYGVYVFVVLVLIGGTGSTVQMHSN